MAARFLALALLLVFAATASAQSPETCTIGVYSDPEGTSGFASVGFGSQLSLYVVLYVEDVVKAVSYDIEIDTQYMQYVWLSPSFGPDEGGLNIASPGGFNVGLGSCVPGFTGLPVLVARHSLLAYDFYGPGGLEKSPTVIAIARVKPNLDQDPTDAIYASCDNRLEACPPGSEVYIYGPVATQSESMGRVKALYR